MPATLLVYAPGGARSHGGPTAAPVAFSVLWRDEAEHFRHIIDFAALQQGLACAAGALEWPQGA